MRKGSKRPDRIERSKNANEPFPKRTDEESFLERRNSGQLHHSAETRDSKPESEQMSKAKAKPKTAPFNDAVEKLKALAEGSPDVRTEKDPTIAGQLERKFGLGSQPALRRRLFERLQLAVEIHGERALKQLQIVAAEANGARKKDRYFCRAALCRLREMNLLEMEDLG